MKQRTLATFLGTCVLAGCSMAPVLKPSDINLPADWQGRTQIPTQDAVPVRTGWWRSFNDPSLTALMAQALRDSPTLAEAQARVEQARGAAEANSAALSPTISLNGAINRTRGGNGNSGSSSSGNSSSGQSLFAQASYEIDFWGKNRAAANSAQSLTRATVFDGNTIALTLTASVADTYFQLLSLRERLALATQISSDSEKLLTLIEAQKSAGVASDLQVELQRNLSATFAAAIPTLQQQVDQNTHLLAVLIGATPEQFIMPDSTMGKLEPPAITPELPATILRRRPDIQAAEARLEAANFDVGVARAAFFPSINLTGSTGYSSTSLGQILSGNPITNLAASLLQPVFDGGALNGQLHFNRAKVTELNATYRKTVLIALQEVEDSLSAVQQQHALEDIDGIAASAARKAAFLANSQYQYGTADFLSVLTAQRALYQAEDALLQVRLQRLQASVALFRTLGGGFDLADMRSDAKDHQIATYSGAK